jgi:DNA-binding MarR family transcriptional regulator
MAQAEVAGDKVVEVTVEDFSSLVSGASRLLGGLSRLPAFRDAGIGVGEWLALTTLLREDGINNKVLARALGVTGQRANQICQSLSRDGLISVSQSADDNRANEIRLTSEGREKIGVVNEQLKTLLSEVLKGKERAVGGAAKQLRRLKPLIRSVKAGADESNSKDKEAKRADREAQRAAKGAARAAPKVD